MKPLDTNVSKHPIFIMLVGPPGVGKSTWCKEKLNDFLPTGTIVRVSSDDYIEEVATKEGKTYTEVFQSAIKYASDASKKAFQDALSNNHHIVWDQTNLSAKKRKGILNQLPASYTTVCIYWEIKNEAQWKKQLVRPGKTIPQGVLDSMLDNYAYPDHNEGWNVIYKEIVK